jgi:Putative zinc-finger
MDCRNARRNISAYLDHRMPASERQAVRNHLNACRACALESAEQERLRRTVRSLPRRIPPADLTLRLRVIASKARAEIQGPGRWTRLRNRLSLSLENLMRPMALPAVGGLCSAVFMFSALIQSFMPAFAMARTASAFDPPTMLLTQPMLKYIAPIPFGGDAIVDVDIDNYGHIIGYTIVSAGDQNNDRLRRSIENNLLFTEFWPATAFGVPVSGTIRISYRSPAGIDVKG